MSFAKELTSDELESIFQKFVTDLADAHMRLSEMGIHGPAVHIGTAIELLTASDESRES